MGILLLDCVIVFVQVVGRYVVNPLSTILLPQPPHNYGSCAYLVVCSPYWSCMALHMARKSNGQYCNAVWHVTAFHTVFDVLEEVWHQTSFGRIYIFCRDFLWRGMTLE